MKRRRRRRRRRRLSHHGRNEESQEKERGLKEQKERKKSQKNTEGNLKKKDSTCPCAIITHITFCHIHNKLTYAVSSMDHSIQRNYTSLPESLEYEILHLTIIAQYLSIMSFCQLKVQVYLSLSASLLEFTKKKHSSLILTEFWTMDTRCILICLTV